MAGPDRGGGGGDVTSCWVTELGMAVTETEHDQGTYQGVPFDVTTDRVLVGTPSGRAAQCTRPRMSGRRATTRASMSPVNR
ncbi:MAG TPA: hypothetical protein VGP96_01080 [Candidatus Dormibacteraeota bacterium]|nr:hypothetical protein [Candidatus Dormibacteraeota bacterium]